MTLDDERDDFSEDYREERKQVEALDLDADVDDDFEVDASDELDDDELVEDEEAEDVETAKAKTAAAGGKKKRKPEDKPFSDYEAGVARDDDWGAEAAGEGEVTSRVGRNAGPLEGEAAEREIARIDEKRVRRQATGNPPPRGRKGGKSTRSGPPRRAKAK